jgi:hypothetical protein
MTVKALKEAIRRAETWPDEAQEELAETAMEIDAALKGGPMTPRPKNLKGLTEGSKAAREFRHALRGAGSGTGSATRPSILPLQIS